MKDVYLLKYSVKGIKTLDQLVTLNFYKKIIDKNPETQSYNIKGIYGMNGSGKSAIMYSAEILRNLLINPGYLNNPVAQKNLASMINKKTEELFIEIEYMVDIAEDLLYFRYSITLAKDMIGKYNISKEYLSVRKATSKSEKMQNVFETSVGQVVHILGKSKQTSFSLDLFNRTINLLNSSSMSALFFEKFSLQELVKYKTDILFVGISYLYILGKKLFVYLDKSDDHSEYNAFNSIERFGEWNSDKEKINSMIDSYVELTREPLNILCSSGNLVLKEKYKQFEKKVDKLYEFLHIFKADLQAIEIERKENQDIWNCDLIMVYDEYRIHAEFESTGIKKLIRLFAYLNEMVHGGIVFIDEFDSNLHDVYLCALLEYLMEYGTGQLCFTTHNVGPMDVLKQHKKSIDFLSENHKIYPWTSNGNYSPSKLYKNGMIEGSPFNVDSTDFIGVFGCTAEDE